MHRFLPTAKERFFYGAFVDKEFIGLNFQPSALTSYISFAEEKRHGYVKTGFAGF